MSKKEADKFIDNTILEGMVSIRALLTAKEQGINNRPIETIWFDKERVQKKGRELAYLQAKAKIHSYPIELVTEAQIEEKTIGNTHGGVIAFCGERSLKAVENISIQENGFYVLLEGIEDPYNFGYTLRSLYAAGVDGIILTPRNWMSAAGVVSRASAGASELFPAYTSEADTAALLFKKAGYTIICADKDNAISVYDADLKKPLFLIVGGEKRGISRTLLELADSVVRLDYGRPFPAALSTASAATILSYEVYRQNR